MDTADYILLLLSALGLEKTTTITKTNTNGILKICKEAWTYLRTKDAPTHWVIIKSLWEGSGNYPTHSTKALAIVQEFRRSCGMNEQLKQYISEGL